MESVYYIITNVSDVPVKWMIYVFATPLGICEYVI